MLPKLIDLIYILVATVTVVVWEGEESDPKSDSNSGKIAENNTASNAINRLDCICT